MLGSEVVRRSIHAKKTNECPFYSINPRALLARAVRHAICSLTIAMYFLSTIGLSCKIFQRCYGVWLYRPRAPGPVCGTDFAMFVLCNIQETLMYQKTREKNEGDVQQTGKL
jgi:hypothetical protein